MLHGTILLAFVTLSQFCTSPMCSLALARSVFPNTFRIASISILLLHFARHSRAQYTTISFYFNVMCMRLMCMARSLFKFCFPFAIVVWCWFFVCSPLFVASVNRAISIFVVVVALVLVYPSLIGSRVFVKLFIQKCSSNCWPQLWQSLRERERGA